MKRKEAVYKGLQDISVYFEDTSLTSPDYFQITEFPLRLTAGKNLFKLRGHPTNLKVGGVIDLEILDYNGTPIYHEIVDYIDEDKSRVVAIYIYSDTSPGDCTITIIAESNLIGGIAVPQEFQGRPNVKWIRSVPVNPNVSNISEIIFESIPTVTVDEIVGVQLNRIYAGNTQFPVFTTGTVKYFSYNNQPAIAITGGVFTSDMSTGTITVATPVNPLPTPNYAVSTTPYISTIKKILSPTTALLDTEYEAYSSQSIAIHTYNSFDASTFSLSYEAVPTYVATENSQSFAYIQVSGLDPSTGDVSRIKVFTNNNGTVGTWELVNDLELTETEILVVNTASLFPDLSVGLFTSQSSINSNWSGVAFENSILSTPPTLVYTTASIDNAMKISSSINLDATNTVLKIQNIVPGIFIENSAYKITIDALGTRSGSIDPVLAIYVSGSSFYQDPTDYFNQQFSQKFGKRIGELRVTGNNQRFDDQILNFESDYTGTGVLVLVVESGNWQVANIRTTTDNDPGYSPNYTRIKTLIQTTHKINNQISFKIEYYNVNGEKSKQISYVYNKDWEGGNRYIDGDYSMLTGSLYVADSLNSGVAISGYPNSGFIRSLGYEGFVSGYPGFLLWSGSALPGQTTKGNVAYSGVGLELYANTSSYFRYSTADSEIDVRTNKFFFGNNSTFISGSNGNLQISSSGFILSPQGNVTASSFIAVNGNNVLFDTNSEFVDGLNVGRIVYFEQLEYTYNMALLPTSASGVTGSTVAGPVFKTFILPGETNMQMSFTYSSNRTDSTVGNRTLRLSAFIMNAISGSNTGLQSYDKFNSQSDLATIVIDTVPSASLRSGANTLEIKGANSGIINSQGRYVLVHTIIHVSNNTSLVGTLKLKNFVFRTSRNVGGSLTQPATGPIS